MVIRVVQYLIKISNTLIFIYCDFVNKNIILSEIFKVIFIKINKLIIHINMWLNDNIKKKYCGWI